MDDLVYIVPPIERSLMVVKPHACVYGCVGEYVGPRLDKAEESRSRKQKESRKPNAVSVCHRSQVLI